IALRPGRAPRTRSAGCRRLKTRRVHFSGIPGYFAPLAAAVARSNHRGKARSMLVSHEPLADAAPWWRAKTRSKLVVTGGRPLAGTYRISGAKNSVLPLMVAALLTGERVTLENAPASLDVAVLAALLRRLGATLDWRQDEAGLSVEIAAERI